MPEVILTAVLFHGDLMNVCVNFFSYFQRERQGNGWLSKAEH